MKSNSVSKRPLEIKNGNVTGKIYTVKNRVNGATYPQFTLVHYLGGHLIQMFAVQKRIHLARRGIPTR